MSSYPVRSQATHKAEILANLRSRAPELDTSPGSDAEIKAGALAHALEGLGYQVAWTEDQVFPDTATSGNLRRHAALRGVDPNAATKATGDAAVRFTGTPSSTISVGLSFTRVDGTEYVTTSGGTIPGGGTLDLDVEAVLAGEDGNVESGEAFTISSPPAGVDSTATTVADIDGGTDDESDEDLLERLLDQYRSPPAAGTASDYERWALEVDGVIEALVYSALRGLGTVDVVCFTQGASFRAPAGSPLLAAVDSYIDARRPVTADVSVRAPTEVPQDVTVANLVVGAGYDAPTVISKVEAAIEAVFYTVDAGGTLYRTTHLHRVISAVEGVVDYDLIVPASDVTSTIDAEDVEVLVPGTVSVST